LWNINIPANTLGTEGQLRLKALIGLTPDPTNRSLSLWFGGRQIAGTFTATTVTNVTVQIDMIVANLGSTTSQCYNPWQQTAGFSTTAIGTTTVDTTIANSLVLFCSVTGTDTATLYRGELMITPTGTGSTPLGD
jgi:hypothetical protein